jgi:hypothetical protein
MDVVVTAASAAGTDGAWMKLLREAGLDFWVCYVGNCKKVEAQVSPVRISLTHSLARPAVGTYCPAQYTIHPALFLAKLHNMYNGVRRNLELVRVQNLLNVDNVAKLNPTKRP